MSDSNVERDRDAIKHWAQPWFSLYPDVYEAGSTTALLQLRFLERGSTLTAFATGTRPSYVFGSEVIESNRHFSVLTWMGSNTRLFIGFLATIDPSANDGVVFTTEFGYVADIAIFWLERRWSLSEIECFYESIPEA